MCTCRPARPLALILTLTALAAAATLPACSPPYVNIPAQSGDVASANPNLRNVREIEIAALERILATAEFPRPVLIQLPPGSDALTYGAVAARLDDDVITPIDDDREPGSVVTVEAIRIRGFDAQVDIIRPANGVDQRVTAFLRNAPTTGWAVERTRTWRGPVESPPRVTPEDL